MSRLKSALVMAAFGHLTLELCAQFLPVVYPHLITKLDLSYAQVGVIALVIGMTGALMQPVFGYLSDRWDPVLLTVLSVAWLGMGMGLVGFTWSYGSLLVLVAIAMLGSAAFHPPGAIIASYSSKSWRGAAVSIFSVGGSTGSALSPLLVTAGLTAFGLPGTAVVAPFALAASLLIYLNLRHFTLQRDPVPAVSAQSVSRAVRRGSAVALVLVVLMVMARAWYQVSLMTYLPVWLEEQGRSLQFGGQMLAMLLFSASAGGLIGGVLSDRIGRWQVALLSTVFLLAGQWSLLSATGLLQIGAIGLIGAMIGLSFPVTIVMAQEAWPQGVGFASSLVMGLGWAPGGLGASITGLIADRSSLTAGLQSLLGAAVVAVITMTMFALVWQRTQRRLLETGAVVYKTSHGRARR